MSALTAAALRQILIYYAHTGQFIWRGGCHAGWVAGGKNRKGYWRIWLFGKYWSAHRLAWLYVVGEWPDREIDHVDCDKLNNRFANLREATSAENKWNTTKQSGTLSSYKGVTWHKSGKWQASIRSHGKQLHLGLFSTEAEAHVAYCKAAIDQHGPFARAA